MSRKQCRRKHWALINTIQHAIDGAAITPTAMRDKLLMRELASLDAFTRGRASMAEWSDLVNVNNLTQTLAGMGIGRECLPDVRQAEAGLIDAAGRYQRTQRMGLSGPALTALRSVIEWHDAQRAAIPRSQYYEAIRLTGSRIKSGHATVDLGKVLITDDQHQQGEK